MFSPRKKYMFSVRPIIDFLIVTQYVFNVVRCVCVCVCVFCKGAYPFLLLKIMIRISPACSRKKHSTL